MGRGRLRGAAEPATARPDQIALAMSPAYVEGLERGQARAAILWEGADWRALGLRGALYVPRARYAMAGQTAMFDPGPDIAPGIHPAAHISESAEIGPGAAIGPFVAVGAGARIGPRVVGPYGESTGQIARALDGQALRSHGCGSRHA